MDSLAGLKKAEAPDYFYTRLSGRMQDETEPVRKPFLLIRPAFVTAALSLVLILNIISLMRTGKENTGSNKPATIEAFAEAYNMNAVSVYE